MTDKTPKVTIKRRPVTAVRKYKIVRDAVSDLGLAGNATVDDLMAALKDAALEEAIAE